MTGLDGQEREALMHRARAEHYAALSRAGDPEWRLHPIEDDFNAGYRAALATREEPKTVHYTMPNRKTPCGLTAPRILDSRTNPLSLDVNCVPCLQALLPHPWHDFEEPRREWHVERGLKGHDVNVIHGEPLEVGEGIRLVPASAREDTWLEIHDCELQVGRALEGVKPIELHPASQGNVISASSADVPLGHVIVRPLRDTERPAWESLPGPYQDVPEDQR
jgi:hypothetical protein